MLASGSPARFAEELRQNLTQRPPTCATNDAQMRRNRRTPPSTFLEGCVNMPWLRPQSYYVSTNVKTICYTENHTAFVEAVQLVLEDLESPCQLPVRNPDKIIRWFGEIQGRGASQSGGGLESPIAIGPGKWEVEPSAPLRATLTSTP